MESASPQPLLTRGETETFLEAFFRAPNVELARVLSATGPAGGSVQAWIARLREAPGASVMLPFANGDRRHWYGLAFGDRQLRVLAEDVLAFVGPSFSTYRGGLGEIDIADQNDRLVLEFTRGHALKFSVPDEATRAKAREALDVMRQVVSSRPASHGLALRPIGRVLRDFYMALRAGDRDAAERHIQYLAEAPDRESSLSPLNILFLRVQALSELQAWGEILQLAELGELLAVRRPLAVTQAIIVAVYRVHIQSFAATSDVSGAVAHFRETVYQQYAGVFGTRAGLRTHEALTLFTLLAVAGPVPSRELLSDLESIAPPGVEGGEFRATIAAELRDGAPTAIAISQKQTAADAIRQGDYDAAFSLARESAPSIEAAGILLDSAYELHTSEAAGWALLAIAALSAEDGVAVLATRSRKAAHAWASQFVVTPGDSTKEPGKPATIASWFEWLLAVKAEPGWQKAQQTAREGAIQWTVAELLADERGTAALAKELFDCVDSEALRLALPHLVAFFQNDAAWPRAELVPVYEAISTILVYSTYGGVEDFTVFSQLVQGLLLLGLSPQQYDQVLNLARELVANHSAPVHLDWMLDVADLLISSPCPAEERRVAFLVEVAAQLNKHRRHVSREQVELFRMLLNEAGQPEMADSLPVETSDAHDAPVDVFKALGRQSVGIYTLTESAGRRFAEFVGKHAPEVTVATNFDKVGSERLKDIARNVDIMVMATASAKHAATEFIERHRPRGRTLLRPSGKGTASMLRALTEYLTQTAP